jgi:hypothetical protein
VNHSPKRFWNAIPPWERDRVVREALRHPEKSPRELAWHITDHRGYFISESSVYRILRAHNLISSPAFTVLSAKDKFDEPTRRVNELGKRKLGVGTRSPFTTPTRILLRLSAAVAAIHTITT